MLGDYTGKKLALDGENKVDDVIIGEELKKSMERHGKPKIPGEDPNGYHVNISLEKNKLNDENE